MRNAAYQWIMDLPEAERCKGFLILEKFNWKPPQDNLSFGFLAYMLTDGNGRGERSARYLADFPENDSIIDDFFMLMTSNF